MNCRLYVLLDFSKFFYYILVVCFAVSTVSSYIARVESFDLRLQKLSKPFKYYSVCLLVQM